MREDNGLSKNRPRCLATLSRMFEPIDEKAPFRRSEVIREKVESLFDSKGYRHQVEVQYIG